MKRIIRDLGLFVTFTAASLGIGCTGAQVGSAITNTTGAIVSPALAVGREAGERKNPIAAVLTIPNGAKKGVLDWPEKLVTVGVKGYDPAKRGRIGQYLEDHPKVDFTTDMVGSIVGGAAIAHETGIGGYDKFSPQAAWSGTGIGAARGIANKVVGDYLENR